MASFNKKLAAIALCLAIHICCFPTTVLAGRANQVELPQVKTGSLYALVVGVSKYKDGKITKLDLADKDAQAFGNFLGSQTDVFKEVKLTLLLNEKAGKAEIEKYLYYTLPKAGKDDTVILFFSGHGAFDPIRPNDFLFLPHDTETEYLGTTAVKMSGLEFLKTVNAERVLIIADACYAGGFSDLKSKAIPSLDLFLKEVGNSTGRVVITSAKPEQLSWENPKQQNSIFTNSLLEGLRGKADRDQDGIVTLNEAYEYAYNRTKDETGGKQHPQLEGKIVGAFPLSVVGGRIPISELRKKLWKSAENGDKTLLEQIISRIPEIDLRDEDNNTPLIIAAKNNHSEIVKILLSKAADVDAANNQKATALTYAVENGNQEITKILLNSGAGVNVKNIHDKTPLMFAALGGFPAITEMLLQEGADVKARSVNGETALSLSALSGSIDNFKILMNWAQNLKIDDINLDGAVVNAVKSGHQDIVKLLITKPISIKTSGGPNERTLTLAVLRGDFKKTKDAVEAGADVECLTFGDTPLTMAASLGYTEIANYLLSKKAAVNRRVANDRTALMYAAKNGRLDLIAVLLKNGGELNAKDAEGNTPLILAATFRQHDTVRFLLDRHAETEAKNAEGLTALGKAAQSGNIESVKLLLAAGADCGTLDKTGNTPLMLACSHGNFEIVKLLSKQSDLNVANQQKNTPLTLAVRYGHKNIVKYLLSKGCDLKVTDWEGKTALSIALEKDREEIAEMLRAAN